MPCSTCGASVAHAERATHACDPERLLDYDLFQLRDEIESLESSLGAWLETPQGRFARWDAERRRSQPG
jgi:hypothetical protein